MLDLLSPLEYGDVVEEFLSLDMQCYQFWSHQKF